MTRGEIREFFLGDKGASKRPELQYIPADPAFLQWNQMVMTLNRTKKQDKMEAEQMKAQQAQAEQQVQLQQAEEQRNQEVHDSQMESAESAKAHAVANHKSLKDLAKESGLATKPGNISGEPVSNPVNEFGEE